LLAHRAWGIHYPLDRLAELAARLGSDVPFFLAGGAAICRGRGEQVTPLGPLPRLHVVVVKPPAGVSTAAAFAALDAAPLSPDAGEQSRTRLARLVDTLRSGASVAAARHLSNRLEPVAERLCPWIARVRHALAQCGALGWMMTGSGSACFAVMRSARHARTAARRVAAGLADQAITDHSAKHDTERPGDPEAPPARAARKDARQTMRDLAVPMMGNRGTVFATATCHAACPPL
ncbi:MAG TPA: hypothetical protein VEQ85_15905, partial [Lacipirellulaceae bacterium]|nr:hypothetical protein [Lacipirellulaceae bacterium]